MIARVGRMLVVVMALMLFNSAVFAVPGFARRHQMSCNSCHTAWPTLNKFGRDYKLNGYRLPGSGTPDDSLEIDDRLLIEKLSFVSGKLNGRLYDKKDTDTRSTLRALHEVELFLAGNAGDEFSYFGEIEAEDENDFNLEVVHGLVGWHPKPEANVVAGYGTIFFADPYDSLSNARRLTRSGKAPLGQSFAAGDAFSAPTQLLTFYGTKKSLYYSATVSTGNGDAEGADRKDTAVRVAYDFPSVTVGGFYVNGSSDQGVLGAADYSRFGVDFQLERGEFTAYGTWISADDDNLMTTLEESSDTGYVEAFYTFRNSNGDPRFVPLLRWETYDVNGGTDSVSAIAAAVSTYVRSNLNISLEYWTETSVPGAANEADRVTLFFNVGL